MPEGEMINFRLKHSEAVLLDQAAKSSGLSRSDYIRNAIWYAIHQTTPDSPKTTLCPLGDPRDCAAAQWTKVGKKKVCRTCGTYR